MRSETIPRITEPRTNNPWGSSTLTFVKRYSGKITAVQAGLPAITTGAMEAHYLAGGNVRNVIRAMIAAQRARIVLRAADGARNIDIAAELGIARHTA